MKNRLQSLKKIDSIISRAETCLTIWVFIALMIMIVFNILARDIFQKSFQGIYETAPVLVVWLTFLGALIALRSDRHIKLEIFMRYFSKKTALASRTGSSFFGMVIMGILFFSSIGFVQDEIEIFPTHGEMAMSFPVFFALASFRYFCMMIYGLEDLKKLPKQKLHRSLKS